MQMSNNSINNHGVININIITLWISKPIFINKLIFYATSAVGSSGIYLIILFYFIA